MLNKILNYLTKIINEGRLVFLQIQVIFPYF